MKSSQLDLASVVVRHGLAADLIIAGQTDSGWCFSAMLDFPERLALESGRPVLVVPFTGRYAEIGSNVVVAWKPAREAARAAFDALPLLQEAQKVHILQVKEPTDDPQSVPMHTAFGAALSRHGIKSTMRISNTAGLSVGDEILARLAAEAADLLVMGAYGAYAHAGARFRRRHVAHRPAYDHAYALRTLTSKLWPRATHNAVVRKPRQ